MKLISISLTLFLKICLSPGLQLRFAAGLPKRLSEQCLKLKSDVVSIAKEVAHVRPYQPFTGDFITWANTRFNDKQDYNTARPLVDVLPVVNYKKRSD